MTHSQLDAMIAESGIAPEEATGLADLLAPLVLLSAETPAPSDELTRIFDGDAPCSRSHEPPPLRRRRRSHGTLAGVVVLALSGVGATGLSAAANTLPSAWQHQVAGFSHHYLPFDFPEPPARKPRHSLPAPDAGPAQPAEGEASGERLLAANDATRSATRNPYSGGSAWQGGPSASGHQTHDRNDPASTPPASHVYAGGGSGEHSYEENHEDRGSSQTPWPRHSNDRDESGSKGGEGDRDKDRDKDRASDRASDGHKDRDNDGDSDKDSDKDRDRDKLKGNDRYDDNDHTGNDRDEYDRAGDRPVRGGGVGAPKDPQKGKPSGGGDQGGSGKDRTGDKSHGHNDPPNSDAGAEGPAEEAGPDPVRDPLSRLPQVAQELLQGDAPRT